MFFPPNPSEDDSHKLFRETCRRFTQERIIPFAYEWEEAGQFPRELYEEAASAGLLGASLPSSLGGSDGDTFHGMILAEELLKGGTSGVLAGLGSLGIALPPILMLGTDAQKERFVPEILAGKKIAALAITEPGTGSDVAGIKTRAVKDGDDYLISGAKLFITSGVRADQVTVLCRTGEDRHGGLTFFVVEKGTPGFEVSKSLKKTGWLASDTAELSFDQVRVPSANRIGDEGTGFLAIMRNFQSERLGLATYGYATAQIVLEDARDYAKERSAFEKPLSGFQVIRHKLSEMATEVLAAKTLTYEVARRIQAGEYLVGEVSMAKNFTAKVCQRVCYEAVQILGGMGYMRETRVERLSRDARLLPIGGGTTEIMNEVIAKNLGL